VCNLYSLTIAQDVIRKLALLVCFSLVAFVGSADAQDDEDFFHLGVIEYEISCLPCHGVDGRGDGPQGELLDTQPTDLTDISGMNGGVFPAERLKMIIDGRALVADHGARAMPVWGERYRFLASEAGVEGEPEEEVRRRMNALVHYVESLQEP